MIRRTILATLLLALSAPAWAEGSPEQKGPDAIEVYNEGVRLMRAKKFAEAQKKFEAALKVKDFAEAHNNLAYCLRKQGEKNYGRALKHYNRAAELAPRTPHVYMYRGVLHVHMGHMELAKKDLETLRGLDAELAKELAWVIEHKKEKEPEQFFGVSGRL